MWDNEKLSPKGHLIPTAGFPNECVAIFAVYLNLISGLREGPFRVDQVEVGMIRLDRVIKTHETRSLVLIVTERAKSKRVTGCD